jgi:hypothetical protein
MEFSIVVLFPEKINKNIEKLKREIVKLGSKDGLNNPSSLELGMVFEVPTERINELIYKFDKFKKDIKPVVIKIDGFEFIENISPDPWIKSTFFIGIKVKHSDELDNLHLKLKEFKIFSLNEEDERIYHPAILLAKDNLDAASYKRVKKFLKDIPFEETITLDNITFILKKDVDYIIYKKLNLD